MKTHVPKDMTTTEIRCEMLIKKVSLASIARDLDPPVSTQTIYRVIEGKSVSDRVRRRIAERLQIDVARIWPQTYLTGGPRKPGRPFNAGTKAA